MRFDQLKYILDIAQTESITLTAERFFVTRQTVSSSIKLLEEEVGRPLLIRTNSRVHLNQAGEEVARFAEAVMAGKTALGDKLAQIDAESETARQHLKICSASAAASTVIPKMIHAIHKNSQNALISVMMTDADSMISGLKADKYALGLLCANEKASQEQLAQLEGTAFHCEILARDSMVACMNKKNYRGDRDYVTMEEIRGQNYKKSLYGVLPAREYAELVDDNLLACSNDADFHRGMLKYNNCIVLMPALALKYSFNSKRFVALSVSELDITLLHTAIYRKDCDAGVVKFVDLLKRYLYMG